MRRSLVLLLATVLTAPCLGAATLEDVTMPDEVTVGDATLQLNGMGVRKKLWVEVYVGGLYVVEKSSDPAAILASDGPKQMVMHFLTDRATKKKMDTAWQEGFEANNTAAFPSIRDRVERFIGFFGDMKDGDVVEMSLVPGDGTTVVVNDQEKGAIEGDDFATALLKVWIGDTPPTDDFKQGVLGR